MSDQRQHHQPPQPNHTSTAPLHWEAAPGGWLVRYGPLNHFTYVPDPGLWADAIARALIAATARLEDQRTDEILATVKRIETMGQTLSGKLDDISAREEAAQATLSADLQKIADAIRNNTPAVGTTITQAQVDRQTAIADSLGALATTADSLVASLGSGSVTGGGGSAGGDTTTGSAGGVVFDSSNTTPNSPGGRNTSGMPGFDPSQPETA